MRKILYWLAAFAVAAFALTLARPAMATETSGPSFTSCANLKGWYANEDEQDRLPVATEGGLKFSGKALIHHAVSMDLKDVKPGSYVASAAPKNNGGSTFDDFFSIEVANTSAPVHYGTLRYELTGPHAGTWNIGGTSLYSPVNPTGMELEEFATANNRSTNAISYGVGYPNSPSDGAEVTVSSVTFHGVKHDLTCEPPVVVTTKPSASASGSASATAKPKPSASRSSSHAAGPVGGGSGSGGALAITGPNGWQIGGLAAVLIAAGGGLFLLTRKRRSRFIA